jgi:hypothetical protein
VEEEIAGPFDVELVLVEEYGVAGREAGQPIVLAAERRMNLFNAGGRFGQDLE